MNFKRIPAMVLVITDEVEELVDGTALINIDEIQDIISGNGKCTIYFKSGDSVGTTLTLDQMEYVIEGKFRDEEQV